MNKKQIILLSVFLGLALALLGVLVMMILGSGGDAAPAEEAAVVDRAPQGDGASLVPPADATAALTAAPTPEPTPAPTEDPRLQLSWGFVDRDVTELVLPAVTEEDLVLIRQLPALALLDGRACENGSLLRAFSETADYPVLWTVALGDLRVESTAQELSVPAGVTAEEVLAALQDLPQVTAVDLRESDLGSADLSALQGAMPEMKFLYSLAAMSLRTEGDATMLELDAGTVSDWAAFAQEIALLEGLDGITIQGALTPEQAALLLEGAGGVPASYSVTFRERTFSTEDAEADFSDLQPSDLGAIKSVLSVLPNIRRVNLDPATGKSHWSLDDADQLQTFREGLLVNYTTTAFGVTFSLADEVVSFNKKNLKRKVDELRLLLPYLRNVKRVDMENCNIDNETMAALRDEFPQPKLVWRVSVGRYTVRTDTWMIKFSAGDSSALHDKDVVNLKYCREVRYLDLGHNKLRRMEFVTYMPDLEVCIMYNPMSSLKGVETCSKLEYFECFSCHPKDVELLAACTELKHLNLCWTGITDISFLYGLTKLERLWISRNDIPAEQIARFKELVPGCEVNTTVHNPTGDGWRQNGKDQDAPRYALLRQQFRYDYTKLRSYGDGWWDDGTVHFGPLPAKKED